MVADGHVLYTCGNTRPMNAFTQLRLITLNKNAMKEANYALWVGKGWKGGKGHDNGAGFVFRIIGSLVKFCGV